MAREFWGRAARASVAPVHALVRCPVGGGPSDQGMTRVFTGARSAPGAQALRMRSVFAQVMSFVALTLGFLAVGAFGAPAKRDCGRG